MLHTCNTDKEQGQFKRINKQSKQVNITLTTCKKEKSKKQIYAQLLKYVNKRIVICSKEMLHNKKTVVQIPRYSARTTVIIHLGNKKIWSLNL